MEERAIIPATVQVLCAELVGYPEHVVVLAIDTDEHGPLAIAWAASDARRLAAELEATADEIAGES